MESIAKLIQDLSDDIDKYAKKFAFDGAKEASRQIVDFAENALSTFYGSYSPSIYLREYNIMNNSYSPYFKNNGRSCYGGIRLSSGLMHEYLYAGIPTGEIFDRVIYQGLHGKFASTPPYDIIAESMDGGFINNIREYAEAAAKNQSFKVLFK